jgi:hypothetical protein
MAAWLEYTGIHNICIVLASCFHNSNIVHLRTMHNMCSVCTLLLSLPSKKDSTRQLPAQLPFSNELPVAVVNHLHHLLLEILRQVQEVEELGHPCSGAAQLTCKVRPRQILQLHGREELQSENKWVPAGLPGLAGNPPPGSSVEPQNSPLGDTPEADAVFFQIHVLHLIKLPARDRIFTIEGGTCPT